MSIIKTTKDLSALCLMLAKKPYVTVDTEFLRDRTYYPRLCLIQIAAAGTDAVAVDPLADGIDLAPLLALMQDKNVVKVFHAARQDLEIFYNLTGKIPAPLFDTQVAAMVCGHGDQIGYNNLVHDICGVRLDKGAQFTDWSRRPLSPRQLSYALDDVTYLRDVYESLKTRLAESGRLSWVQEEMAILTDPATYENPPEKAWERIKVKSVRPDVLAVLQAVADWREREAQRRDIPRGRVLKDEVLADIAVHPPKTVEHLCRIRNISADMAKSRHGKALLDAVKKGLDTPKDRQPAIIHKDRFPPDMAAALEMLKMLLRIQSSKHGVAAKLIASSADLERVALDPQADIPAMKGWRYDVFGQEAQKMFSGKLALTLKGTQIVLLDL